MDVNAILTITSQISMMGTYSPDLASSLEKGGLELSPANCVYL